jgi:transcriptional regulator with XRE-family HTH domain
MELSQKLKKLRKEQGLTQLDLSESLSVSRQAISGWEAGTSRPSTENLQFLSKLYNVPMEYLLDDSKDKLPSAEGRPGRGERGERKLWIRWLVIGAVVLALLAGCFFWYESQQNENGLDLHSIQGEGGTTPGEPDFSMTWE